MLSESGCLPSFEDALKVAKEKSGKVHVLLGNGFSIGAHESFKYGTLYEQALNSGLSSHVEVLFERYGTTNFEEVLRQLDEGGWLATHYRLKETDPRLNMIQDYERVKEALVNSIATNHPQSSNSLPQALLLSASDFLNRFDSVYTTNYDLLLYWASLIDDTFIFQDGFGREPDTDDSYCVFLPTGSDEKHIYFLHGALHLYTESGEVRKRVWQSTGVHLMDQIRDALEIKEYPLIVSEGDSESKEKRIEASSYLSYCQRKFENIYGSLFIYGSSLSEQDEHILDWIVNNTGLERLFVAVYGDAEADAATELIGRANGLIGRRQRVLDSNKTGRRFKRHALQVEFFASGTAQVWARPLKTVNGAH